MVIVPALENGSDVAEQEHAQRVMEGIEQLPEGEGWLLVEFGGDTTEEADERARECMSRLKRDEDVPSMKLIDDEQAEQTIWEVRENGLGATAYIPMERDHWPGWEDSAVQPARLGSYLREFKRLLDDYRYRGALYGHFGDGCVHTRISFDLMSHEGVKKYRAFIEEASDLVVRYGGSFSGEHGDGQSRGELLVKMFGLRLDREWALQRHGPSFFRRLWGELHTLEWLGAAHRDEHGWQLTARGMYWLMLMMCAFFESVAEYREAMRAHIPVELNETLNPCVLASASG